MNRTQLEHIIRAASRISDDSEIVVIGSQAVHAQQMRLPPIAYMSEDADVYPRNYPERSDDIDFAIGELSSFHETDGYCAHGVSPTTAILAAGSEQRLIRLSNSNTDDETGFCLDVRDVVPFEICGGAREGHSLQPSLGSQGMRRQNITNVICK
jgi:hypothetical protein